MDLYSLLNTTVSSTDEFARPKMDADRKYCLDNTLENKKLFKKLKLYTFVEMKVEVREVDKDEDDDATYIEHDCICIMDDEEKVHKALKAAKLEIRKDIETNLVGLRFIEVGRADPRNTATKKEQPRPGDRERYVQVCLKRASNIKSLSGYSEEQLQEKIKTYRKHLTKCLKEYNLLQREKFKAKADDLPKKLALEFDKILEIPKITKVEVDASGKLYAYTTTIYCTNPETKIEHEIGAFCIEIDANEEDYDNALRMKNLTRTVNGYDPGMHAPHVFSEGHPCLGSIEDVVPDLLSNYEYAALIMVVIQFLESVNPNDDAGQHITEWPRSYRTAKDRKKDRPVYA